MTIYQDDLDFVKEAAEAFNNNVRWETYRNEELTLIALREGVHRDGMVVYRLGQEVGDFREVGKKAPDLVTIKQREEAIRQDKAKPFDVRQAMLDRPNEWVGAYTNFEDKWFKVGFDVKRMRPVRAHMNSEAKVNLHDGRVFVIELGDLDLCIPIEDVPEEATR